MFRYKQRRCWVCGKFHASYLVPDGKGGKAHYCYSCWKAWQAAQQPATLSQPADPPAEQDEASQGNREP